MPPKLPLPLPGETVGKWRVIERSGDYTRSDGNTVAQFRAQCVACGKELVLKIWELSKRNCVHCLRAQESVSNGLSAAELTARIEYAYEVHKTACAALRIAPEPLAKFETDLRADPSSLLEAPPLKTVADYEQRNYLPHYSAAK